MARSTEAERERLHETFAALCRIPSPSYQERAVADRLTTELRGMGLAVEEDDSGAEVGSDAGNLLARIPGASDASILLCAHMDTVPLAAPVEPVLVDGAWENANDGILGADNKSALAIIVELARRLSAAAAPPPVGIEILFTVCEEVSLRGSARFDVSRLRSSFGFVFDHATPIGELVVASPSHYRILAEFRGRAAHAGVRPEAGRSAVVAAANAIAAMRLGRLDAETTANVGTITGGSAINVIPERCRIEAEVRSIDAERAAAVTTEVVDHLQDAANAGECDLDLSVESMFAGYRTKPRAPQLAVAERALRACGYEPRHISSGGASDANSFQAAGFLCLCLADGVEHNHEPTERVHAQSLETMFDIALTLVDEAAVELGVGGGARNGSTDR
ncbi:MAG TPA: M20/M25/M40 family metallo-hydrolase [Solirubrobacteraceae bacterium]|nr:M20/M25/M40 family metallo-hydrolase [Solirubrobacteraceae bacterium]